MIQGTIAIRYARALIELARENDAVDAYGAELKRFLLNCEQHKELLLTLANKGFDLSSRVRVLHQIAEKTGLAVHVRNFLKLLIHKGRIELIGLISEEYQKLADRIMNRCPMTVISAVELPEQQYHDVADYFSRSKKMKMVLAKKIDPDVLGGVCVRIGDEIYDDTLRARLEGMKQGIIA